MKDATVANSPCAIRPRWCNHCKSHYKCIVLHSREYSIRVLKGLPELGDGLIQLWIVQLVEERGQDEGLETRLDSLILDLAEPSLESVNCYGCVVDRVLC